MSKRVKQYLMLLAALGVVAVALGGGSGTFASFNAEVQNNNNVFATGTLFLHQRSVNSDLCRSEDNANNLNANCSYHIDATDQKPGDAPAVMEVALTNAGSINASTLNVDVSCTSKTPTIGTIGTDHSSDVANTITSLNFATLSSQLVADTDITIDGAVYTVGTTTGSGTNVDVPVTSTSNSNGPASGDTATFSAFGTNNLCSSDLQFTVQEMTSNTYTTQQTCYFPTATSCVSGDTHAAYLTANSNSSTMAIGALNAAQTRYFKITVALPSGVDNSGQNSEADFDVHWTAAQ